MSESQALPSTVLTASSQIPHPAELSGDAQKEALNYWLRSGRDHHQPPEQKAPSVQLTPGPDRADQSPWALLLPGSVETLGLALELGAEANRSIFVAGPHGGGLVSAAMIIVNGPLEEATLKISLLKDQHPDLHWDERWPGHDHCGDALIHLIVSAQFSDTTVKPKLAEAAIIALIEETVDKQPHLLLMRDAAGRTAVQRALELQRIDVANFLLSTAIQAQSQAVDHQGQSALHSLASNPPQPRECLNLVRTLVQHGASWGLPDNNGVTAAQLLDKNAMPGEGDAWRNLVARTTQR